MRSAETSFRQGISVSKCGHTIHEDGQLICGAQPRTLKEVPLNSLDQLRIKRGLHVGDVAERFSQSSLLSQLIGKPCRYGDEGCPYFSNKSNLVFFGRRRFR